MMWKCVSEMYSRVITGAVHGGRQLSAADRDNITNGLLSFHMVGFMSGEVETIYPVICSNGQKPRAVFWLFYYGGHIFWRPIFAVLF